MSELIVGFAGGVGVCVIGVLLTHILQKRKDVKHHIAQTLFETYMLLMELEAYYFWIASAEMRGEDVRAETKAQVKKLGWRIADKLRGENRIPHLQEILTVLMSEGAFENAQKRHDAIIGLLKKLGAEVNPNYAQVVSQISRNNLSQIALKALHERKAPCLLEPY